MNRTGHADSFPQNKEWDNNPPKFQAKFGVHENYQVNTILDIFHETSNNLSN